MNRRLTSLARVCVFSLLVSGGMVLADPPSAPSADAILKGIRRNATTVSGKDMTGTMRSGRVKVPFRMSLKGDVTEFYYNNGASLEGFQLKFKTAGQDMYFLQNGKFNKLPVAQYGLGIMGTSITYEDLSMRFLYWPNGKVLPQDKSSFVNGYDCWVIELRNPSAKTGNYAWMRVWVGKDNGSLWQIDGIGANGELSKRFVLSSVMKLKDGTWFFKKMRVEHRDPANSTRTTAVSYIDMTNL